MSILHVASETGALEEVLLGFTENFHLVEPEVVNETQRHYYGSPEAPTRERLLTEFAGFEECLRKHGARVWRVHPVPGVPDQLTPRDIAFVVGDRIVIGGMAKESRRMEWRGLDPLLARLPADSILRVPEGIVLEGGDVVVDRGRIFVGLSQRTGAEAIPFLEATFPGYEVVPVKLRTLEEGEDVLHLDCAFVPVGLRHALIFPAGMETIPEQVLDTYELIEVDPGEQKELATNVLSISPNVVISRTRAERVNHELRAIGLEVCALEFNDAPKTGGSFRCCSLPIRRASGVSV